MSFLKGINRSAAIAWSPFEQHGNLLVSASAAGTTDNDFDNNSHLEILNIDTSSQDPSLQVKKKIDLPDRVHSIAWGTPGGSKGIIAGGLPSGGIVFVDGNSLLGEKGSDPIINTIQKHTTPVTSIHFNKLQPQILASGAENSEVYIWNLANPESPVAYAPGTGPSVNEPITDVKWNAVFPYILGTTTQRGKIVVWDLRNKRPAVQFSDKTGALSNCRTISWSPTNSMQLVTASEDDSSPVIQIWNLRNTQMPVTTLRGHTQGVWATSWCPHDPSYLLSTGKESRAICWNVETGRIVDDIPLRSEWNSDIQWSPTLPASFAVSSHQGQIGVYSLHDVAHKHEANENNNQEVYAHPPAWLKRPAGAIFGFGGKLIEVQKQTVHVKSFVTHPEIIQQAEQLEELMKTDDNEGYCKTRAEAVEDKEEAQVWEFFGAQFSRDHRSAIIHSLGYHSDEIERAASALLASTTDDDTHPTTTTGSEKDEKDESEDGSTTATDFDSVEKSKDEEDVSNLFGSTDNAFGEQQDDPFGFQSHGSGFAQELAGEDGVDDIWGSIGQQDSFFGSSSSNNNNNNNDTRSSKPAPTFYELNKNFRYLEDHSNADQILAKALLVGNFTVAVECCLHLNRLADAFVIARESKDDALVNKVNDKYYASIPASSFLHLLKRISTKQLESLVAEASVDEWKCTLAVLCTYADESFAQLADQLGDTLYDNDKFHEAVLCYICARDLNKAVNVWDKLSANDDPLHHLQSIMEKITVFQKLSGIESAGSSLINKYCDFAELLAAQGQLLSARTYISAISNCNSSRVNRLVDRLSTALDSSSSDFGADASFDFGQTEPSDFDNVGNSEFGSQNEYVEPPTEHFSVGAVTNSFSGHANQTVSPAVINANTGVPQYGTNTYTNPFTAPTPAPAPAPVNVFVPQQPTIQELASSTQFSNHNQYVAPAPITNPFAHQQTQHVQPFNPYAHPAPVTNAPSPVTQFIPTAVTTLVPNAGLGRAPAVQPDITPPVEKFPDSIVKKVEEKEHSTEIIDTLIASIEQYKQRYAAEGAIKKELEGCGNDRIDILRTKIRRGELDADTVAHVHSFINDFATGNKAEVKNQFDWLTKHSYTAIGSKTMLGLKKLSAAAAKF